MALDSEAPFCGLVFKVQFDGDECLHFVRVYSGVLRVGQEIGGSRHSKPITVEAILHMHAAFHEDVDQVVAGDVVGLELDANLSTGETLFDPGHRVLLEDVHFPAPVLTVRLESVQSADFERLAESARRLCREDPTLMVSEDSESGALLVSGMGELHLAVFEERLAALVRRPVRVSQPQVMLRETVSKGAVAPGECWRHLDGEDLTAKVELAIEPDPGSGPGRVGDVQVADPRIAELVRSLVETQIRAGLSTLHAGHDLQIRVLSVAGDLVEGQVEAVLGEAVAIACRRVVIEAGPVTLEPYVDCAVSCPSDSLSGALADLRSRGAEIRDVGTADGQCRVVGVLPLAAVIGYATTVRSLTRGLGAVHLRPVGLRPRS